MFDDFKLNVVINYVLLFFSRGVGNPTTIWRFRQMGGYPHIIHFNRIFHEINQPAIGDSPFMEPS